MVYSNYEISRQKNLTSFEYLLDIISIFLFIATKLLISLDHYILITTFCQMLKQWRELTI